MFSTVVQIVHFKPDRYVTETSNCNELVASVVFPPGHRHLHAKRPVKHWKSSLNENASFAHDHCFIKILDFN